MICDSGYVVFGVWCLVFGVWCLVFGVGIHEISIYAMYQYVFHLHSMFMVMNS